MNNKQTTIYCIEHQDMFHLEDGVCICGGHEYTVHTEFGDEVDFHCLPFPLAYCPPPPDLFSDELDYVHTKEWRKWVEDNQPDYDEILVSDLQALSLRLEIEEMGY